MLGVTPHEYEVLCILADPGDDSRLATPAEVAAIEELLCVGRIRSLGLCLSCGDHTAIEITALGLEAKRIYEAIVDVSRAA